MEKRFPATLDANGNIVIVFAATASNASLAAIEVAQCPDLSTSCHLTQMLYVHTNIGEAVRGNHAIQSKVQTEDWTPAVFLMHACGLHASCACCWDCCGISMPICNSSTVIWFAMSVQVLQPALVRINSGSGALFTDAVFRDWEADTNNIGLPLSNSFLVLHCLDAKVIIGAYKRMWQRLILPCDMGMNTECLRSSAAVLTA